MDRVRCANKQIKKRISRTFSTAVPSEVDCFFDRSDSKAVCVCSRACGGSCLLVLEWELHQ